jgi:hypothetical protein
MFLPGKFGRESMYTITILHNDADLVPYIFLLEIISIAMTRRFVKPAIVLQNACPT